MAFDGVVVAALVAELQEKLVGGRISKISMPEKDELHLMIRNKGESYRLLLSAGASLPLAYLTRDTKPAPDAAPAFCMLLRKHAGSAHIRFIEQMGLERVFRIVLEHVDDLGDLCIKYLYVELMGKYSNLIFTDDHLTILDSIKRIPSHISSLREVLPGKTYFIPEAIRKLNPLLIEEPIGPAEDLYRKYEGISPLMSQEIAYRAESSGLSEAFSSVINTIKQGAFSPSMIIKEGCPVDFSGIYLQLYENTSYSQLPYDSISELLHDFYSARDLATRMHQKSADLRKAAVTARERTAKKLELQEKQWLDCEKKEQYKVFGDLLRTYGYSLSSGASSFTCENYYDGGREITIPLDPNHTAAENAKRYYEKYAKLRRTRSALEKELPSTREELDQLNAILQAIDHSESEGDLAQIRDEMEHYGFLKQSHAGRKAAGRNSQKAEPLHFISSDGYDIYVGKNNYQNEQVTFRIGDSNDLWFHAKGIPGSHVLVKLPKGQSPENLPDRLYEEAAGLAAYYSSAGNADKVEVDYTLRRELKRTPGGVPGFVIYHTNYSLLAVPGIPPQP